MAKKSRALYALPPAVGNALFQLGEHIRIARKRRRMTLEEMSSRMFVTRKTLSRLENGDPGVSLAVFASALWVLGFDKTLLDIVHPERDKAGIFQERHRLPWRVRHAKLEENLDFSSWLRQKSQFSYPSLGKQLLFLPAFSPMTGIQVSARVGIRIV